MFRSFFSNEEIDLIHSIPISMRASLDHLIWHFEKNGKFTVRSAYHQSWVQPTNIGASPLFNAMSRIWSKIWDANVPPKVKVCIWRLYNSYLPTRAKLVKRHLLLIYLCVMCDYHGKTTIHIVKDCPHAKCAWMTSPLRVVMRDLNPFSFMAWIEVITEKISHVNFDPFLRICWAL